MSLKRDNIDPLLHKGSICSFHNFEKIKFKDCNSHKMCTVLYTKQKGIHVRRILKGGYTLKILFIFSIYLWRITYSYA